MWSMIPPTGPLSCTRTTHFIDCCVGLPSCSTGFLPSSWASCPCCTGSGPTRAVSVVVLGRSACTLTQSLQCRAAGYQCLRAGRVRVRYSMCHLSVRTKHFLEDENQPSLCPSSGCSAAFWRSTANCSAASSMFGCSSKRRSKCTIWNTSRVGP